MIQAVKVPKVDTIFLSNNPILIEVKTDLGADAYFKVHIWVDGKYFDGQGWSKYNNTNCIINLEGMFDQLFVSEFTQIDGDLFDKKSNLKKRIFVEVAELRKSDDVILNTIEVNRFYVIKSDKKIFFDDRVNLQKMSILPNVLRLSKGSNIRFPLWVTTSKVKVNVVYGSKQLFDIEVSELNKEIVEFDIDLANVTDPYDEMRVTVTNGNDSFTQKYIFKELHAFKTTKLYFRNHHGLFEYVEIFGALKETNKYKRKLYSLPNNSNVIANTAHDKIFKINTGFLLFNYLPILEALNSSKEVYLFHEKNYIPVLPISKKSKGIDSQENYIDDYIEFKVNGELKKDTSFKYD